MNIHLFDYSVEKNYRVYFDSIEEIELDQFVDIELILLCFYRMTREHSPFEAWSILTGYPDVCGYDLTESQKRMLMFVQLRYRDVFAKETIWEDRLQEYISVDSSYRLFLFYENGTKIRMQRPRFDLYTDRHIPRILSSFRGRGRDKKEARKQFFYPTQGTIKNIRLFVYYQILKAIPQFKSRRRMGDIQKGRYLYKGSILSSEIPFSFREGPVVYNKLPLYKNKSYFVRNELHFDRVAIGEEMGEKWKKQVQRSLIQKNNKTTGILPYHGQSLLIAGGVGVGKNAFIEEEIYRMLAKEKKDVRFMVVVRTNQSALDFHTNLQKLGIESTVLPGLYSKEEHETEYIERILKKGNNLSHLMEASETLNVINSDCLFQIYYGLEKEENTLPCSSNKFRKVEGGEEVFSHCPFLTECGLMRPFLDMNQTNVWITTPYALKTTSVPRFIDEDNRTLQELAHDLVDVVFVDEVDEAMNIYDADSIQETVITGGLSALNSVLQLDSRRTLYSSQSLYSNNYINQWIEHLHQTDVALAMLHQMMETHLDFHNLFQNKVLNIYELGNRLLSYVEFASEDEKDRYHETLFKFLSQDVYPSDTAAKQFIDRLRFTMSDVGRFTARRETKREAVQVFFRSMNWKIKANKTGKYSKGNDAKERAELTFELFTYIHQFEENFRKLVVIYPIVKSDLQLSDGKMNFVMGIRSKLFRLLEATPTGHRFGYRMYRSMDRGTQKISILRYNGQTRKLLTEWHHKFDFQKWKYDQDGHLVKGSGPTVIGLSGTAYVPGSPHFHVPFQQTYKLKNKFPSANIACFTKFIPTLDEMYDYLYTSGAEEYQKNQNLQTMTEECFDDIERELSYWKECNEKRHVLIVTTSYQDTKVVAETFAKNRNWSGRFGFLTRETHIGERLKEYAIRPSDVEVKVPDMEIDVLIAPIAVISRGYNILQKNSPRSYFGSMFVFVRPYYIVGDMENTYKLMHGQINDIIGALKKEDKKFASFVKGLHQGAHGTLKYLLTKPFYSTSLTRQEMEQLCWYTLVLIQQTAGRLLRGDTDARVIFVDAKMHYFSEAIKEKMQEKDIETSMIVVWTELLNRYDRHEVMLDCFGPLKKGLDDIQELDES